MNKEPCEVIVAAFTYGPVFCGNPDTQTVRFSGVMVHICSEHELIIREQLGEKFAKWEKPLLNADVNEKGEQKK